VSFSALSRLDKAPPVLISLFALFYVDAFRSSRNGSDQCLIKYAPASPIHRAWRAWSIENLISLLGADVDSSARAA
jgi:hypothetical protein